MILVSVVQLALKRDVCVVFGVRYKDSTAHILFISRRLPPPMLPPMSKFGMLYQDAISIAVVAFANNFAMANLFARKQSYDLDSNTVNNRPLHFCPIIKQTKILSMIGLLVWQEFIAYGITNIGSSFFSCYISAASLSRSLVQEAVGGRTQVRWSFHRPINNMATLIGRSDKRQFLCMDRFDLNQKLYYVSN